jgi:hypothetical protein
MVRCYERNGVPPGFVKWVEFLLRNPKLFSTRKGPFPVELEL